MIVGFPAAHHLIEEIDEWQVISEEIGLTLEKADLTHLGRAKKASISKDDTILLDGAGSKDQIEERNDQLRQMISKTTSDYDR